jgi:hypothetical protein
MPGDCAENDPARIEACRREKAIREPLRRYPDRMTCCIASGRFRRRITPGRRYTACRILRYSGNIENTSLRFSHLKQQQIFGRTLFS